MNEYVAAGLLICFQILGVYLYVREHGWKLPPDPAEERFQETMNALKKYDAEKHHK